MRNTRKQKQAEKKSRVRKQRKWVNNLMAVLNGDVLSKDQMVQRLPFVFYMTFMFVLFIGYGYYCDKTSREIGELDRKVNALRLEEISIKEELTHVSMQSQVAEDVAALGLIESVDPPKQIETTEK